MDEPKGKEEAEKKESEKSAGDNEEGNKPEVYKTIDDANLAAKRMEDANKEKRELLDREEELMAKRALGGGTNAGQEPVKKEVSDEEYAKKALSGELNIKGEK